MYVRVWEYEVEIGRVDAFLAAYRADGEWAQLFERADGYAGTERHRRIGRRLIDARAQSTAPVSSAGPASCSSWFLA
jgi:hypothetical protein